MPSRANHPNRYSYFWFPGDGISYPFHDIYSHELNKDETVSMILVYEFEHITRKGRMCLNMISFSQPGFMGSKMKWNTTVHDKENGYKRPSFRRSLLLPLLFSTIHRFIRNRQLNRLFVHHLLLFTYSDNPQLGTDDNQYGSTGWAVWLKTTPRGQCGSIR